MTKQMSATSLLEELNLGHKIQIIDVREPDEFSDWSIPSSINLPLGELARNLEEIDRSEPVLLVCLSGGRAEQAASILT
ncbi:MAG: rhodanese-like domain-containing protein, partial [Actinomycetes bacterium]